MSGLADQGGLVLSRKVDEAIEVGGIVRFEIIRIAGVVRVRIVAPGEMDILRFSAENELQTGDGEEDEAAGEPTAELAGTT